VSRGVGVALAALITGCGNLPTTQEGVAFLQIVQPANRTIEVGDSLQLRARALDKAGQPLDVAVQWRTPDTTISVANSGLVKGLAPDSGRVQAVIGNDELVSDFITVFVKDTAAVLRRP
jgi:hypothetical protein